MLQDFVVRMAFFAHHGGSNLAKTHAVTPAFSFQDELGGG